MTDELLRVFRETCPNPNDESGDRLAEALVALKTHRDKRIAHPEVTKKGALPDRVWGTLSELVDYAKKFLEVTHGTYLDVYHKPDDDDYFVTQDAKRIGYSLVRLLQLAEIAAEPADPMEFEP